MATTAEVREGLRAALATIPGVDASAYMRGTAVLPAAWVLPDEIEYDKTFGRGHDDWYFLVQVFVAAVFDQGGQQRLDLMLEPEGPNSVKAAIEADDTLGGVVQNLRVETCSGYRQYPRQDGSVWLGAEWRVKVIE